MTSTGKRYCDLSDNSELSTVIVLAEMALDTKEVVWLEIVTQRIGDERWCGRVYSSER
jgi:hypothetical protein